MTIPRPSPGTLRRVPPLHATQLEVRRFNARLDADHGAGEPVRRRRQHASGEGPMAWRLEGKYFESCSCDAICPCTWSALTARATHDRCRALLAYHVDSGEVDGVDVSGLSFALFLDTPPV